MGKIRAFLFKRNGIFHVLSIAFLVGSLCFSVFYFQDVFSRTVQSVIDLALSLAYYFTEVFGFYDVITPTVNDIPQNAVEVLPFDPLVFQAKLEEFGALLIDGENFSLFCADVGQVFLTISMFLLPVALILLVVVLILKNLYLAPNKRKNTDTKPLQAFKKFEAAVLTKIKIFFLRYRDFLNDKRWYVIVACILWAYNLNFMTIAFEAVAFLFYVCMSFDWLNLYTQIAKFAFDMTVSAAFLPLPVWILIGYLIFDAIRRKIGFDVLNKYEEKNRKFLNEHPGALFLVGKQRAKKTTIITDMALSQEMIFREEAHARLFERDRQFPYFPWINVEELYYVGQKKGTLPTLASFRRFIRFLRDCFEKSRVGVYDARFQRRILKALKQRYGYKWNNFLFDYDFERYGLHFNDNLSMINVLEAVEGYIQLFFIYAAPTSLKFTNYAVRDDKLFEDDTVFPDITVDFFKAKAEDVEKDSHFSHVVDWDSVRLGKLENPKNKYKDGFEVGILSAAEVAKERGNQITNQGIKASADECNAKNDLFEINVKMQGHASTIDNYTFFRLFMDDQRAESLSADNRDLSDVILIKGVSDAKIVMPGFAFGEGLYVFYTKIFKNVYYSIRKVRGDNTLLVYLLKKVDSWIYRFYKRIYNQYGVYTAQLNVWNAMLDEKDVDEGKYFISIKKTYSGRFATDSIKDYYNTKALQSKVGLNDYPSYGGIHMTVGEMNMQHSHFYKRLNRIFNR